MIGPPGAGKTSVAEKITYDIITGNCPEEFKNNIVLSLDVTSSVAGTQYRGQAEERYSAFAEFLVNQKNVIVFICSFVGVNAVFEMIASTLITGAVGTALKKSRLIK